MASKSLDDLDSRFRPLAERLLFDAIASGIPCIVTCTLRDHFEQAKAVTIGNSQTMRSKHLPQPPKGKALAMDICPEALIKIPNYAPADPLWWRLGDIGLNLGLRWGGVWDHPKMSEPGKIPPWFWDPGHFELRLNSAPKILSA